MVVKILPALVSALAVLTALLVAPPSAASPWANVQAWETARVMRVVDGDTVIVRDAVTNERLRIRVLGINAPEIDTALKGGQCGGWQAKAELEAMLPVGSQVRLLSADQNSKGKADRPQRVILAYNQATGEFDLDVAWALAERGWGLWFTVAREAAMSSLYRAVIAGAQDRRDGMWNPNLCGELEQPEAAVDIRIGRAPVGGKVRDEWVSVRNIGATDLDLTGWILRDSGNVGWYTFPGGSILAPGDYRVVHTGSGADGSPNPRDLYINHRARLYPDTGTGPNLLGDGAYLLDRYTNYRFWREYPCTTSCEADPHNGVLIIEDFSLGQKKGVQRARTQWVRLLNRGDATVCLDGYRFETGSTGYRFTPGTCLAPGATYTVHVKRGIADDANVYLGRRLPVLWNSGTMTIRSDRDQVIARRSW